MPEVRRGDVWLAGMKPVRGHEQGGKRPVLVVSDDSLNRSRSQIAIVVPFTTRQRGFPSHVAVTPNEGGLREISYAKCEDVRSITQERLEERWGEVSTTTMEEVENCLALLLRIPIASD